MIIVRVTPDGMVTLDTGDGVEKEIGAWDAIALRDQLNELLPPHLTS